MIHYLERKWGVHFAMGGTGALVQALVRLFTEMGGKLRLNSRVEQLLVENGTARGVRLTSGEELPAKVVVSNADVANFYKKAVPAKARKKWTNKRLDRMRYSMGLFLIYFGTDRTYPDLAHHTIVLGERYKELLEDIFQKKILADDFSLYLHAPTRTDPSLAPPGCECFYVLSPVPNLGGPVDWNAVKELRRRHPRLAGEALPRPAPAHRQQNDLDPARFRNAARRPSRLRLPVRADPHPKRLVPPPQRQRRREEFLPRRRGHPSRRRRPRRSRQRQAPRTRPPLILEGQTPVLTHFDSEISHRGPKSNRREAEESEIGKPPVPLSVLCSKPLQSSVRTIPLISFRKKFRQFR